MNYLLPLSFSVSFRYLYWCAANSPRTDPKAVWVSQCRIVVQNTKPFISSLFIPAGHLLGLFLLYEGQKHTLLTLKIFWFGKTCQTMSTAVVVRLCLSFCCSPVFCAPCSASSSLPLAGCVLVSRWCGDLWRKGIFRVAVSAELL